MAGDPDKNWGLVALMGILILAVLAMTFFSFKWARPGDRYASPPAQNQNGDSNNVPVVAPPVVAPTPAPVN